MNAHTDRCLRSWSQASNLLDCLLVPYVVVDSWRSKLAIQTGSLGQQTVYAYAVSPIVTQSYKNKQREYRTPRKDCLPVGQILLLPNHFIYLLDHDKSINCYRSECSQVRTPLSPPCENYVTTQEEENYEFPKH